MNYYERVSQWAEKHTYGINSTWIFNENVKHFDFHNSKFFLDFQPFYMTSCVNFSRRCEKLVRTYDAFSSVGPVIWTNLSLKVRCPEKVNNIYKYEQKCTSISCELHIKCKQMRSQYKRLNALKSLIRSKYVIFVNWWSEVNFLG